MIEKFLLTSEKWNFLLSKEKPDINSELTDTIRLPSTAQQMKKPPITDERSDGFLTDPYRFEGYALYRRTVNFTPKNYDCDLFLVMERTRTTSLWIDGKFAGTQNSLCASHRYDITKFMKFGEDVTITVMVDNVSCPVPGGHMTSQDTQTNWLGITGEIYLECKSRLRYENIKIAPDPESGSVTVSGEIVGGDNIELTAEVNSFGSKKVTLTKENPTFVYEMPNAKTWSEHDPNTYIMKISCGG
ncbi:MAG: beta-glucuronidase, partial [Oscillospiraceae bacterium]|nr:beta-glucuronidase [Oscillospiraceae bacterium]